jgi:streptogramin lyase
MPTTEEARGRRLALVVATASYQDPTLSRLRAPGRDASDLAGVLGDEAVGGFGVETILDAPAESLRRRIAQFCSQVSPSDLTLVYLSCHGVLDDRGRLYYATVDTDKGLLSATAVSSAWLNEQLEDCRCRRQILVLDCCHSGAFAKGSKGEGALALRERFEGRGRVVLTGSRGTEYSFEGDHVEGDDESATSVFTGALVQGLRSGEADRDGDGVVTISELYDHAYEVVQAKEARQTPTLWTYGAEGDLLVAHSPRGPIVKPAPLPEDLLMLLESARPRVREGAVAELTDLLAGPDASRALTARAELERIANEDVRSVASAARAALDAAVVAHEPPFPPPSVPPPPPSSSSSLPSRAGGRPPSNRRRNILIGVAAIAMAAIAVAIAALGVSDEEAARLPSGPATVPVGGSPSGIAAGEGGVWVVRHDKGEVTRVDSSLKLKSVPVGNRPGKIVAGEGSVWVSYENGSALARIDPDTPEVTERVPVGSEECVCAIEELAISQGMLWTSSPEEGSITKRDLDTGDPIEKPYKSRGEFDGIFAVGDGALWAVGNEKEAPSSTLYRIDLDSSDVESKYSRPDSYFAAVAYGDGTVWIADSNGHHNSVIAYDPKTERQRESRELDGGVLDDDLAVVGQGVVLWNPVGGWLTRIDANTMKPATEHVLGFPNESESGNEISDLAIGGGTAWVTDPEGKTVRGCLLSWLGANACEPRTSD